MEIKRATVTVPEAARLLGISTWSYYERAKRDELPCLRIGRRVVVPRDALDRLLEVGFDSSRPHHPPGTMTVPEAARALGISSWAYYEAIKQDELPYVRVGGHKLLVPKAALEAILGDEKSSVLARDIERATQRFWREVKQGDNCWEWTGARDAAGYGVFRFQGKTQRTHRVAWILTQGTIPDSYFVCHRCDHPPCVRPDHLFLGMPVDNVRDSQVKGRRPARGHIRQLGSDRWRIYLGKRTKVVRGPREAAEAVLEQLRSCNVSCNEERE